MIYFVYKCVVNNSVIKRSNTKQIKTMERNNNFEVALVKLACPICGKEVEEQIIMNQKLTPKEAAKIKAMHGKIVGYANKVCDECAKYKDKALFVVEIIPEKSDMKHLETIYRTGRYLAVLKNCNFYKDAKKAIIKFGDDSEMIFVDEETFSKLNEIYKNQKD